MTIEEKMIQMEVTLPPAPAKGGIYASVKPLSEKLYYVSGCGPLILGKGPVGKISTDLTIQEGQAAARLAMMNFLSVIRSNIGELERIKSFVKVLVFVAGPENFYEQPTVADGATGLLTELFGEEVGAPSRSAIGASSLPGNVPVEIEGIIEVI